MSALQPQEIRLSSIFSYHRISSGKTLTKCTIHSVGSQGKNTILVSLMYLFLPFGLWKVNHPGNGGITQPRERKILLRSGRSCYFLNCCTP
jgi:hypothetical protein